MYFLTLFSSPLPFFLVLSTSQAGPATQVSGALARGPLAERLNVDYVRATWWAAYHPNMTVYDLPYDKYNIYLTLLRMCIFLSLLRGSSSVYAIVASQRTILGLSPWGMSTLTPNGFQSSCKTQRRMCDDIQRILPYHC